MSILGDVYDAQIKGFEGYAPTATWDYKQNSSGWGTRAAYPGEQISQDEAQRRYDAEIAKAYQTVHGFAPELDPGTKAALTSLTYNAGADWQKSGLGQAIKSGDLDRARASFLQYVNAGGQPLDGLAKRRAAEVAWFGQAAPQQALQQPQQQPKQQASQAAMADPQSHEPSFLEQLNGRMANPLFQQGLGMFLAASQGGDLNQGANAGMSRSEAMRKGMMEDFQFREAQQQQQQIAKMLQNPQAFGNLPPALLEIARATKNVGPIQDYIIKAQTAGQTDDIKEFQYAQQNGFKGNFQEWMNQKRAQSGSYAKEFTILKGPKGEDILIQPSSQGGYKQVELPGGSTLAPGVKTIDTGTEIVTINAKSGDVVARQPKQLAEAERQKAVGEAQGKAQVDLPGVESNSRNIHAYIDGVANDPYLDNMIGWNAYTPNVTPQARAVQAKINQLSGQGFLIAFQGLKGAGAITEQEGAKATAALSRLQEMVQSGKDYRKALVDFKAEVTRLQELARAKANPQAGAAAPGQSVAAPTPTKRLKFNPQTGELE